MNRPTITLQHRGSSGRVPLMKGCLKSPAPSPGIPSSSCSVRKTVAFGQEGTEEVHFADVWDRTPMEPARKLTYQDMLELKEVQRSLPLANQLDDPISGKPARHLLRTVPIGLLPLLPNASSVPSQPSPEPASSSPSGSSQPPWASPDSSLPKPPSPPRPPSSASSWAPPHLAHLLPAKQPPQRQKPNFAFLPLLETPPSPAASSPQMPFPISRSPSPDEDVQSDTDNSHDPPTPSLTNASLDSSPLSRASSLSPEPPFLQLPPLHGKDDRKSVPCRYSDSHEALAFRMTSSLNLDRERSSSPPRPPKTSSWQAFPYPSQKRPPSTPPPTPDIPINPTRSRPRNVMIVNGIEIDLDDDEDSTPAPPTTRPVAVSSSGNVSVSVSPPPTRSFTPCGKERQHAAAPPPKPTYSPTLTPSSPIKCSKSLCSPVRFQRDKSKVGSQA